MVVAPNLIHLNCAHDRQKANEAGPDVIEDDNDDQGQDAQADHLT